MSKQTEREELTAHTPGPWDTEYNSCYDRFEIRSLKQGIFGHFCGWSSDGVATEQEDKANARLIAAAPELLAENKRLRALVQRWREVILGRNCR
jgi:hypothetical protein